MWLGPSGHSLLIVSCAISSNTTNNSRGRRCISKRFISHCCEDIYVKFRLKPEQQLVMTALLGGRDDAAITLLEKRPEKFSYFEWDSKLQRMCYWCNALPTEPSKPHGNVTHV